jgi:RecB family exonuclease
LLRGTVAHDIMEKFVKDSLDNSALLSTAHLSRVAREILDKDVPWPAARAMWLARLEKISTWFVNSEIDRQTFATPVAFEDQAKGKLVWEDLGFTLNARADRIDQTDLGDVLVYDYKTGTPPSAKEQTTFDKQLLIEAAMIEEGAFETLGPQHVAQAVFIGLGSSPREVDAPLTKEPPRDVLAKLRALIIAYLDETQGFTARRMMQRDTVSGDYDLLARFGEWDATDAPYPEDLK